MNWDDLLDYDDMVGSGFIDTEYDTTEDKHYDPDGVVTPDDELNFDEE